MSAHSNDPANLDAMRDRHRDLVRDGTAINPGAGRAWFKPHGETEWCDLGPTTMRVENSPTRPTRDSVWTAPIATALACDIAVRDIFAPRFFPTVAPQRWRKRAVPVRVLPKPRMRMRRAIPELRIETPLSAPPAFVAGDVLHVYIPGHRAGKTMQHKSAIGHAGRNAMGVGSLSVSWQQRVAVSHDDLVSDNIDIGAEARRAAQHISARQDAELLALMRGNVSGGAQLVGPLTVGGVEIACEQARAAVEKDRRS